MDTYERITKMENILNQYKEALTQLNDTVKQFEQLQADYKELLNYYESPVYLEDYDLSNQPDFKRIPCGVLSEDAVYNLIWDNQHTGIDLIELGTKMIKS